MKIAIGADGSGFELKEAIRKHLEELNIEYVDYAKEAREYYDIVPEVAPAVQMANSYKGIRAAVVESTFAARMCRAINNSNVLTMGGFIVAPFMACEMVDVFLNTQITEGLDDFHDFLLDAQEKIKAVEEKIYK